VQRGRLRRRAGRVARCGCAKPTRRGRSPIYRYSDSRRCHRNHLLVSWRQVLETPASQFAPSTNRVGGGRVPVASEIAQLVAGRRLFTMMLGPFAESLRLPPPRPLPHPGYDPRKDFAPARQDGVAASTPRSACLSFLPVQGRSTCFTDQQNPRQGLTFLRSARCCPLAGEAHISGDGNFFRARTG